MSSSTLVTVALGLFGSGVLASAVAAITTSLRTAAVVRRDGYAAATATLVAWSEYPFRIRRRTSDSVDTLAALAGIGHDLQERLARQRAWVAAESRPLSEVFDRCVGAIGGPVGKACKEAWTQPPVTSAAGMNLNGFGPRGVNEEIATIERAVAYRFGVRRLLPPGLLRRQLGGRTDNRPAG